MHDVLFELGFILIVLFAGGLFASRFRQSVIPAYILVGLVSQGFVVSHEFLGTLAAIGLILLMFFIGLEFSLSSFLINWRRTLSSGALDLGFNFPLGVCFGLVAGMGVLQSVCLGAIVYMSSTAIITKTMVDSRLSALPESEVVLRILVFEDLLIAVLIALLVSLGQGSMSMWTPLISAAKVAGFFVILTYAFRKALPLINRVFAVPSAELFIMLGLGFVVIVASLGAAIGISDAVGAFVAGMLFAETKHKGRIQERLSPFRDLCAAIFFLYFGMTISLGGISYVLLPALALTFLGFAGKLAGGVVIGRGEKLSDRASLGVGFGLMPRGEFSIIVASMIPVGLLQAGAGYDLASLTAVYVLFSGILGAVAMREYPKAYFWYVKKRKRTTPPREDA